MKLLKKLARWIKSLYRKTKKRGKDMAFGLETFDELGVKTLGTEDFTLSEIFRGTIAATPIRTIFDGEYTPRSDYIHITVPGYDPATCRVIITPLTYYSNPQSTAYDPCTPVHKEIGAGAVGILTYRNHMYKVGRRNLYAWRQGSVQSILQVVKVL